MLQYMAVIGAHRPVLEEGEPYVGPVGLTALLFKKCLPTLVAAMQRGRVRRPTLPDAGVAVGLADTPLPRLGVADDVDALHALQWDPPVGPSLAETA